MDSTLSGPPRRPGTRPFIGGRPAIQPGPLVATTTLTRPFPVVTDRHRAQPTAVATAPSSPPVNAPAMNETPQWSVAVYEPGLEHVGDRRDWMVPPSLEAMPTGIELPPPAIDDLTEVSLALADAVNEAGRHAASLAAAEVLDGVARRLRSGEILLRGEGHTQSDAAIVASVLAALLGDRR